MAILSEISYIESDNTIFNLQFLIFKLVLINVIPDLIWDPEMKKYHVYILASKRNGTLYIGVTSDLVKRVFEHKNKIVEGFTEKYDVSKLVYYEETPDPKEAILREKRLKTWERKWKLELIEKNNPEWEDLYPELL